MKCKQCEKIDWIGKCPHGRGEFTEEEIDSVMLGKSTEPRPFPNGRLYSNISLREKVTALRNALNEYDNWATPKEWAKKSFPNLNQNRTYSGILQLLIIFNELGYVDHQPAVPGRSIQMYRRHQ